VLAPFWKYELSHFHEGRADRSATGSCGDDLQVSMISGIFVELLGTLFCFLSGSVLSDLPQIKTKPLLITCLDNVVGVALVIAAFDLTGGYFNPNLALGIKLGCGQGGHLQHLTVCWVGPCVGALIAAPVYNGVKAVFVAEKARDKKIKNLNLIFSHYNVFFCPFQRTNFNSFSFSCYAFLSPCTMYLVSLLRKADIIVFDFFRSKYLVKCFRIAFTV
jgi:hypothetical protein